MPIRLFLAQLVTLPLFILPLSAAADSGCFDVTDEALKLARALSVVSEQVGVSSSPVVDQNRPYGASSIREEVRRILANPKLTEKEVDNLHRDALRTFQIVLRFGAIDPGSYRLADGGTARVTAEQIKLQQHFNFIDQIESAKTGVDPKRPYGDFECWELDMAEALGERVLGDEESACEDSFTAAQHRRFQLLHESMLGFVRALLAHGKLTRRRYKADGMMIGVWEKCE